MNEARTGLLILRVISKVLLNQRIKIKSKRNKK